MLKIAHPLGQILVDKLVLKNTLICSKTKSWPNLCTAATSELLWMVSKDPKGIFSRDEVNNESKWNLNSGWASGYFLHWPNRDTWCSHVESRLSSKNWMKEELWENLMYNPKAYCISTSISMPQWTAASILGGGLENSRFSQCQVFKDEEGCIRISFYSNLVLLFKTFLYKLLKSLPKFKI